LDIKTVIQGMMKDLDETRALAAKILWNLSFNSKCLNDAKNHVDLLNKLLKTDNPTLCDNAKGILFLLEQHNKPVVVESPKATSSQPDPSKREKGDDGSLPHIMISYQWDSQNFVKRVATALRHAGYKIWLDIDDMQGSTLEAMANAVEGAVVVLICMTKKYKESPNCRSEAEYTNKLRKTFIPLILDPNYKPDGWLGLMLGEKLYYVFRDDNFEDMFASVTKVLGGKGKATADDVIQEIVEHSPTVRPPEKAVVGENPILKWSVDDVLSWLEKERIQKYKTSFQKQEIDGRALWILSAFVNKDSLQIVLVELEKRFGDFPYGNYLGLIYSLQKLQ